MVVVLSKAVNVQTGDGALFPEQGSNGVFLRAKKTAKTDEAYHQLSERIGANSVTCEMHLL
jgi:hypothetical protein